MSLENMDEAQVKDLAALADKLANDPKTRTTFLRMTKTLAPNTVIPELDIEDKIQAFAKPHIEKVAGLEAKLALSEAKENVRNARHAAQKELGLSDADMEGVEKLMVDHQIPNYKSGAEFFRLQRNSAIPTPAAIINATNELPPDAMAAMKKGPVGLANFARNTAATMITDIRNGKLKVG